MNSPGHSQSEGDWLWRSGLLPLFRVFGLALQPAKLGLALAAVVATFVLGSALDFAWVHHGVDAAAIDRFIVAQEQAQPFAPTPGEHGIFDVWRKHSERCLFGFMGTVVSDQPVATGATIDRFSSSSPSFCPLTNLAALGYGIWWMISEHYFFFGLFALGSLLIWALGGGAVCRLASVQFARDDRLTASQGFVYAKAHLFDGFLLAPCIPIIFALVIAGLLVAGGFVLRIPVFGDIVGGIGFGLALFGGFLVASLLVGVFVGGHLFWPAIAADGRDAYDAFAVGMNFAFAKPWKTVLYAAITTVYFSVCWIVVTLFTYLGLSATRWFVGFGASWWDRGTANNPVQKLELLWPMSGPSSLYAWPDWSQLAWNEYIAAFFIALYVLLVIGLLFAFLASFYYCGSTVIYLLLRRDVDRTDLAEVYMEDAALSVTDRRLADNQQEASSPVLSKPKDVPASPPSEQPCTDVDLSEPDEDALGGLS